MNERWHQRPGRRGWWTRRIVTSCVLGMSLAWCSGLEGAGSALRLEVRKGRRYPIRVEPMGGDSSLAASARDLLERDLEISGWFRPLAKVEPGAYEVRTVLTGGSELRLEGRLLQGGTEVFPGLAYRGSSEIVRAMVHSLANDIIEKVTGEPGFCGTRIICSSDRAGHRELFVLECDGGNLRQLTSDRTLSLSPHWAPDSRRFVYTSYASRYPDLVLVDTQTQRRQRIAAYPGLNTGGAISPDGSRMAMVLSKDGNPEIYTMALGGGGLKRLTWTQAAEASPSWSPDGQQLVYVSDDSGTPQLYVIGAGGGRGRRVTFAGTDNNAPEWSVKSNLVAYASRRGGRYQICVWDPGTGQEEQVTQDGANHEDPSWAPDGRHIVYGRREGGSTQLRILDTWTKSEIGLTRSPGSFYTPHWSMR